MRSEREGTQGEIIGFEREGVGIGGGGNETKGISWGEGRDSEGE